MAQTSFFVGFLKFSFRHLYLQSKEKLEIGVVQMNLSGFEEYNFLKCLQVSSCSMIDKGLKERLPVEQKKTKI